jgi:hypothetical protein
MGHFQELVKEGVIHRFAQKSGVTLCDKVVKDVDHRPAVACRHLCKDISHFFSLLDSLTDRQTILFEGIDLEVNGFFHIGNCLFSGLPLANAAGQVGTFGNPIIILARIDYELSHGTLAFDEKLPWNLWIYFI